VQRGEVAEQGAAEDAPDVEAAGEVELPEENTAAAKPCEDRQQELDFRVAEFFITCNQGKGLSKVGMCELHCGHGS
jgi:hypothetical protein